MLAGTEGEHNEDRALTNEPPSENADIDALHEVADGFLLRSPLRFRTPLLLPLLLRSRAAFRPDRPRTSICLLSLLMLWALVITSTTKGDEPSLSPPHCKC